MDEETFQENAREAEENLEDESSRTREAFRSRGGQAPGGQPLPQQRNTMGPDPGASSQRTSRTQNENTSELAEYVRSKLPQLADAPDALLAGQQIDSILRAIIQSENNEQSSTARNLEARLHSNFQRAVEHPAMIPAGMDNRSTVLHIGRFQAGAGILLQKHWEEGRKSWGAKGVPSINNYDMEALGAAGCVTAKGWDVLHHPGNPDISIRLFSVTNVGQASSGARMVQILGEEGIAVHDNMKEVGDMTELKLAMRNLKLAARQAAPWNFSFEVLDSYLLANDYMDKELAGVSKKASVLAGFIDHVLKVNASRYTQQAEFLDLQKLATTWTAWWGARKSGQAFSSNSNQGQSNKSGFKNKSSNQGSSSSFSRPNQNSPNFTNAKYSGPPSVENMCKRFNNGNCNNHYSNCGVVTTRGPLKLYHLCNYSVKRDGKFDYCKQRHERVRHESIVGKNN